MDEILEHFAKSKSTFFKFAGELLVFLTCASFTTNAQIAPQSQERFQSLVDSRFASTSCPGLSVAIASENNIIFSKAWGKADVEQNVPMTAASVQRLASLSKPITGSIVMSLVEQGKLKLDDSIRKYLPELLEPYQKVTIRDLLSHQSGVQFAGNNLDIVFSTKHYASSQQAVQLIARSPVFEPGSKVEYSSAAFLLLGAAAETVTKRSFTELSSDFFAQHHLPGFAVDDPYILVPNRVRGYLVDRNSKIELNDGQKLDRDYLNGTVGEITNSALYDISNRYPAGGFDASAEDLLRFVIAIGKGKVLKPETVTQMWTAQKTSDGTTTVFGLGWGVSKWKDKAKMVGMNGLELSTEAFLRYLPESGIGMVVVCNAEGAKGVGDLLNDLMEIAVH